MPKMHFATLETDSGMDILYHGITREYSAIARKQGGLFVRAGRNRGGIALENRPRMEYNSRINRREGGTMPFSDTRRYLLMHKDLCVAAIDSGGGCAVYSEQFLPYNIYLDEAADSADARVNNLINFYHWCASRVLTLDRAYAKEILNSLGRKQAVTDTQRADTAIAYHCLTLTDVYWVKAEEDTAAFNDISLYSHSLSDAFVDVSLRGKQITAQNAALLNPLDAAGDVSVMGVAPKAWVRRNGQFYLYKDGDLRDVRAELTASRIARCFKLEQVLYEEAVYDGAPVSASRLITSVDESIVSMEYMDVYAANRDTELMDLVLSTDPYGYHMMNIIDYLTGNTDRHWGNWGFTVSNADNRILRLHPLMDFNKAFTAYDTLEGRQCQTASRGVSQLEAALEGVRQIGLNQLREVDEGIFEGTGWLDMFRLRLEKLKTAAGR